MKQAQAKCARKERQITPQSKKLQDAAPAN